VNRGRIASSSWVRNATIGRFITTRSPERHTGKVFGRHTQTRVEHQEQHGLQTDKTAQGSDLSRRQIAISSEAFAQAGSTAADTKIDFR
jgi:hypothetical protein